uniref:Uncharacterized protein n=1 Tax=Rhizophora mucronata TaxID=61149 RepID=A0A2P2QYW8_RHIMU
MKLLTYNKENQKNAFWNYNNGEFFHTSMFLFLINI